MHELYVEASYVTCILHITLQTTAVFVDVRWRAASTVDVLICGVTTQYGGTSRIMINRQQERTLRWYAFVSDGFWNARNRGRDRSNHRRRGRVVKGMGHLDHV